MAQSQNITMNDVKISIYRMPDGTFERVGHFLIFIRGHNRHYQNLVGTRGAKLRDLRLLLQENFQAGIRVRTDEENHEGTRVGVKVIAGDLFDAEERLRAALQTVLAEVDGADVIPDAGNNA